MSAPTTDGLNDGNIRAFKPGERVRHADLGEGVVIAPAVDGFIKVFFPSGERQMPVVGLSSALSRSEAIVLNAKGDGKRALRAWLCYQAHALPLMDNVSCPDLGEDRFAAASSGAHASRRDGIAAPISHRGRSRLGQND